MFRALRKRFQCGGSGFTLLELLVVIVILGIAAAILVPQLNVGAERARLARAARSIVQASRYARAMALQHQAEVEVIVRPASGDVEVRAHSSGAKADILLSLAEERLRSESVNDGEEYDPSAEDGQIVNTNVTAEISTAQNFADEISEKFENAGMTFEFLGYTDNVDNGSSKPNETDEEGRQPPFTLVFRSNGTCRPCKVRALTEDGDDYLDVTIDMIGKAKIEERGDGD